MLPKCTSSVILLVDGVWLRLNYIKSWMRLITDQSHPGLNIMKLVMEIKLHNKQQRGKGKQSCDYNNKGFDLLWPHEILLFFSLTNIRLQLDFHSRCPVFAQTRSRLNEMSVYCCKHIDCDVYCRGLLTCSIWKVSVCKIIPFREANAVPFFRL